MTDFLRSSCSGNSRMSRCVLLQQKALIESECLHGGFVKHLHPPAPLGDASDRILHLPGTTRVCVGPRFLSGGGLHPSAWRERGVERRPDALNQHLSGHKRDGFGVVYATRINTSSHNSLVHPKNYMIKGATTQSSLPKHTQKSTTRLAPISFHELPWQQKTLRRGCRLSGMLSEGLGTNMQQRERGKTALYPRHQWEYVETEEGVEVLHSSRKGNALWKCQLS
ncbi:unnamed protein product [Leuciscus chuanchicus]